MVVKLPTGVVGVKRTLPFVNSVTMEGPLDPWAAVFPTVKVLAKYSFWNLSLPRSRLAMMVWDTEIGPPCVPLNVGIHRRLATMLVQLLQTQCPKGSNLISLRCVWLRRMVGSAQRELLVALLRFGKRPVIDRTFRFLSLWVHVSFPLVIVLGPLLKEWRLTIGPLAPSPILTLGVKPTRTFTLPYRWVILPLHLATRSPLLTVFNTTPPGKWAALERCTESFYLLLSDMSTGIWEVPRRWPAILVRAIGLFPRKRTLLTPTLPIQCTRCRTPWALDPGPVTTTKSRLTCLLQSTVLKMELI